MKFNALGTKALRTIGVVGQGVPVSPNDMLVAFEACQDMFDALAAQRLTIFQTLRKTFPIVANQGSPANPYTIGVGGDLSVPRPTWIPNAGLVVNTTSPSFEIPLEVLEPGEYAAITIKDLASGLAEAIYFDGKFDQSGADVGLGQLFVFPVPDGSSPCDLALYLPYPMTGFADIGDTDYTFPPGYAEALRYQLAKRLASEFQVPLSQETAQLVIDTFAVIQRNNVVIPTLRADFGLPGSGAASGLWNWRTGTGGGR